MLPPITCPHCQHVNRPTARICASCGKPLPASAAGSTQQLASARLLIRYPGQANQQDIPLGTGALTLGRAPDNDIVIPHPYVSGHHARIERAAQGYRILDLNSKNGLLLNGRHVTDHRFVNNDVLRIGDAFGNSVSLTYLDPSAPSQVAPLALNQPHTLIGRDPQATLSLSAPAVSWRHAQIDLRSGRHIITDLHSTNGTFVNGARIRQPTRLQPRDVVQIGPFQLVYDGLQVGRFSVLGNVRLDALHLRRAVPSGHGTQLLLNDVSLSIQPKEFVALVGSSGAGKSTLMNALSGLTRAEGQVLLNGADFYRQFEIYRAMLGYVPQDDIIHKGLPVASALRYTAELRLPPDASRAEIERHIREALDTVELEDQRTQRVSSLSGGQRKRVSIAAELLAQPALFFLDEPTSGLDPGLEKKMMFLMRKLADAGQTIVLVTHATANIDRCDLVAFMARGRLVFFGPPSQATIFFNAPDFSDIYSELDSVPDPQDPDKIPREWESRFKQSPYYQQYVAQRVQHVPPPPPVHPAAKASRPQSSPLRQWLILLRRNLELIVRDRLALFVLLAVMPLIGGLMLMTVNRHDLTADQNWYNGQLVLFMLSLAAVFLGLFSGAYEIVREQAIYARERMVNLAILPYILSKVGVLFIFSLIQAALLLGVMGFGLDYPSKGILFSAPGEFYITLVLAILASITTGLMVSALARTENIVIYLILLLLFLQIIFAGNLFDLPAATQPISWLTVTHWTLEALGSSANLIRVAHLPGVVLRLDYTFTASHLFSIWSLLGAYSLVLILLTALRQTMKDRR